MIVYKTPTFEFYESFPYKQNIIAKKENNHNLYYLEVQNENVLKLNCEKFKGNLFEYQKEDVEKIINNNRLLIAHETGLGKTIMMITTILNLQEFNYENLPILIVAPKTILNNWKNEIAKHTNYTTSILPDTSGQIWLSTYARVRISVEKLKEKNFFILISDEANFLKNIKAKQTKAFAELKAKYKYLLTATPIKNSPTEVYSLAKILDCSQYLFGNYWNFLNQYGEKGRIHTKTGIREVIVGYKNLPELKDKIKTIMIKRDKSDEKVIKDIGKLGYISKEIFVDLSSIQKSIENGIENEIEKINEREKYLNSYDEIKRKEILEEIYKEKLPYYSLNRILTSTAGAWNRSTNILKKNIYEGEIEYENNKIEEVVRIINDEVQNNEQVVIFTNYIESVEEISKKLNQEDIKCVSASSNNNYIEEIEKFKQDKSIKALVMTNVGKYGINLQNASYLIFFDLPYTFAEVEQLIGRIVRVGQQNVPIIYTLISGKLELEVYNGIIRKKEWNII